MSPRRNPSRIRRTPLLRTINPPRRPARNLPPEPPRRPARGPGACSGWDSGSSHLSAAGYGLLTVGLNRYLQSRGLRESIGQQTAFELRASAGYLPVTARGLTLFSDGLAARGEPSAPLRDLQARGLRARCSLAGLWRRVWKIEELRVERLQAAYGDAAAAKYVEHDLSAPPALQAPVDKPSPIHVEIRKTQIARADLSWGRTAQDLGCILGVENALHARRTERQGTRRAGRGRPLRAGRVSGAGNPAASGCTTPSPSCASSRAICGRPGRTAARWRPGAGSGSKAPRRWMFPWTSTGAPSPRFWRRTGGKNSPAGSTEKRTCARIWTPRSRSR